MKVDDKAAVARLDIYLLARTPGSSAGRARHGQARSRASIAPVPAAAPPSPPGTRDRDQARHILQHEYAHHFMRQYFSWSYPVWFSEGFAEYFAPTVVEGDTLRLGDAADMRIKALERERWIPMDDLLDGAQDSATREGMVYAQGWLLTHYMLRDAARADQLQAYFAALRAGQAEPEAFAAAFKTDKAPCSDS
jgi:hypothetical protein